MTDSHPVFVDGQTLTHDALNDLHGFLNRQDQRLGQLIGFGIACGLEVTIDGDEAVVSAGLAIDQLGRPIVLRNELRINLGRAPSRFDWLEESDTGTTVVLTLEETVEDAPECEEDGCTSHASTVTITPVLQLARGCLEAPGFQLSESELSGINPITVSKSSQTSNRGVEMTRALVRILGDQSRGFTSRAAIALADIQISTTEIPGAAAYKAAFLNQVFFAMIEFLRCEALTQSQCFRDTTTPGIALGCQLDGRWICEHAHHWAPHSGLSSALLGTGCEDPCRFHRARITAMIENFVLPDFPEPDEPPKPSGPPVKVCKHSRNSRASLLSINPDCFHLAAPSQQTPDLSRFESKADQYVSPSTQATWAEEIYQREVDPWVAGVADIGVVIGCEASAAVAGVSTAITDVEGTDFDFEVVVIDEEAAGRLPGYEPAFSPSITDQIVLVQNADGMVVATGRVPVNNTLNEIRPTVTQITADAATATATATQAAEQVTVLGDGLAAVNTVTSGLQLLLNGSEDSLGLVGQIAQVDGALTQLQTDVSGGGLVLQNDLMLELTTLRAEVQGLIADAQIGINTVLNDGVNGLRQELSGELNVLRATVTDETNRLEANFDARTTEVRLELGADQDSLRAEFQDQVKSTGGRIDDVLIGQRLAGASTIGGSTGRPLEPVVGASLVDAFRSMATAVMSTTDDSNEAEVRTALDAADRSITRMEAAADLGVSVPAVAGGEIVNALERMAEAAEAAGVSGRRMSAINSSIRDVRTELQP